MTHREHAAVSVLRWLVSVGISVTVVIWTLAGNHSAFLPIFGACVVAAVVYDHGWKIDWRRGRFGAFVGFYLLPAAVVFIVMAYRAITLLRQ